MSNLTLREILNNATIILCVVAAMRILLKMTKAKREIKEEERKKDWTVGLSLAFFIELLCIIMLIFNLLLWKSFVVPIGIILLAFIMQYDKVLNILCNEQ